MAILHPESPQSVVEIRGSIPRIVLLGHLQVSHTGLYWLMFVIPSLSQSHTSFDLGPPFWHQARVSITSATE